MNRPTPQQGCIARWLYGKGPRRLVDAVGGALHRIPAAFWRYGAIALGVVGIGAVGAAFWPKPLEYGVPQGRCVTLRTPYLAAWRWAATRQVEEQNLAVLRCGVKMAPQQAQATGLPVLGLRWR